MRVYEDKILTSSWYNGDPYEDVDGPRKSAGTHKFEVRTFSVEKFPEQCNQNRVNALLGDMFQSQIQPLGSNLTVLYFQSRAYAESKSTTEFKSIRANQQSLSPIARFVPSFSRTARDWNYVNDQVQSGAKLCDMMMYVVQHSPRGEGEEADRYLRTVWMNAGFTLRRNDYLHMPYLVAALPLSMGSGLLEDFKAMKRTSTLITSSMALLAPVQGEPLGFRRPDLMLLGRRGQLFNWSPFANEEEGSGGGNHNVAVIGGSGSGKSYLMQETAVSMYASGATVDVFDDGESFKNTVKLLNGQHINFNLNLDICINPFSMCDHTKAAEDNEYMSDCKAGIVDIVLQMALGTKVMPGQPSQHQRGMVAAAVAHVWNESGYYGTITQVAKRLSNEEGAEGQVLVKGLSEYIEGGAYSDLFNKECNLKAESRFLVYELSPLESKPELRAVVVLSLLMVTAQRMKFAPRSVKKALIIDEAWKMLADGAAGSFIEGFARRCRKMGGSLITGTQSLDDYEKTSGAQACIQNSEWVILMKVKPEALQRFESNNILACSEAEMQVLRSLRTQQGEFSEMYIRGPGCQVVARLSTDKFTGTLFSTKPETFDAVNDLVARGLSVSDAVYNVAHKIEIKTEEEKTAEQIAAEFYVRYPALARFGKMYAEMSDGKRGPFVRHIYNLLDKAGQGRVEDVIEVDHAAE